MTLSEMPILVSDALLWRGMTRDQLESQYRLANHPDRTPAYARMAQQSAATRSATAWHPIRYGPHPRERIELYLGQPHAPLFAFIHGGYWRGLEMEMFSYVAQPFVERGIWVANIEYPLAPEVSVSGITRSCFRALRESVLQVTRLGGAGSRLVVSGHSAGGHLAAAALAADRHLAGETPIQLLGSVPISGLFDLEPLRRITLNDTLQMDAEEAHRLSPVRAISSTLAPVIAAVGSDETDEFRRQSIDYAEQLRAAGSQAQALLVPGRNHFTVLDALCDPNAPLFAATLGLLG